MAFKAVGKTLCFVLMLMALICPDFSSGAPHYQRASNHVCFTARNTRFGRFYAPKHGRVAGVKLVHLYGYVSCHIHNAANWSPWGCGYGVNRNINVVITNAGNHVLLPPQQFGTNRAGLWHRIPGYDSMSPTLELKVFIRPFYVRARQELRLWYGEDLKNYTEGDNGGMTCARLDILYL